MLQVRVLPDPPVGEESESELGEREQMANVTEYIEQSRTFLGECVTELKKVYWPTRQETVAFTVVVLIVVAFVAVYLGIVDYILSLGLRFVFGR